MVTQNRARMLSKGDFLEALLSFAVYCVICSVNILLDHKALNILLSPGAQQFHSGLTLEVLCQGTSTSKQTGIADYFIRDSISCESEFHL